LIDLPHEVVERSHMDRSSHAAAFTLTVPFQRAGMAQFHPAH